VEDYHSLVNVNRKCVVDRKMAMHIYKNITGLSFTTLSTYGRSYNEVTHDVHSLVGKYPGAIVLARDPTLDQHLLQMPQIEEVLTYLQHPFNSLYYRRKYRPADVHKYCQQFQCSAHEPVLLEEPHCAKVDVMIMYCWLQSVGYFRPTAGVTYNHYHSQVSLQVSQDLAYTSGQPPQPQTTVPLVTKTQTQVVSKSPDTSTNNKSH
jgi:hypothetical protein